MAIKIDLTIKINIPIKIKRKFQNRLSSKFHNLWTRYKDRKSKGIFGVTRLHEGIGFNRGQ